MPDRANIKDQSGTAKLLEPCWATISNSAAPGNALEAVAVFMALVPFHLQKGQELSQKHALLLQYSQAVTMIAEPILDIPQLCRGHIYPEFHMLQLSPSPH